MTTTMSEALAAVAGALERFDERRHVTPARLEISQLDDRWVAQLMADPLPVPMTGTGPSHERALQELVDELDALDWRRVRR